MLAEITLHNSVYISKQTLLNNKAYIVLDPRKNCVIVWGDRLPQNVCF